MYSMGIAALANENFGSLIAVLRLPRLVKLAADEPTSFLGAVDWPRLQDWFKQVPDVKDLYFPACEWLFKECREPLRQLIPNSKIYERLFDRFEIIRSLVFIEQDRLEPRRNNDDRLWGPPGRFVWKLARSSHSENDVFDELIGDKRIEAGLISAGIFDGSRELFSNVVRRFGQTVKPEWISAKMM